MRQTISGLVAAIAVITVSAAPAMACGGLFGSSCSPCGQGYVSPCAQSYVPAPVYSGCHTGCGWSHQRLPDPEQQYGSAPYAGSQYYYVNQGPTYTGPGNFAPYPTYQESAVSGWDTYRHRHHYRDGAGLEGPVVYSYHAHRHHRHYSYAPLRYGYRERVLRRYY
jgi:hypothetical protein